MTKQSKHIKRIAMPKTWPLARKGNKYVMKPTTGKSNELSLPVCIIFRDVLGLVRTKKDMKKILLEKEVLVNNKTIDDVAFPVSVFDIISVPKIKKHFRVEMMENGKLTANETDKDVLQKPYKVIGKKVLSKERMQINLFDGRNYIVSKEEARNIKINDSVIVDLKENRILKHVPLKQNAFAWVIKGKHVGKKGIIAETDKNFVTIKTPQKQIKTIIRNIFITK